MKRSVRLHLESLEETLTSPMNFFSTAFPKSSCMEGNYLKEETTAMVMSTEMKEVKEASEVLKT